MDKKYFEGQNQRLADQNRHKKYWGKACSNANSSRIEAVFSFFNLSPEQEANIEYKNNRSSLI
jgi:hypothetical protein